MSLSAEKLFYNCSCYFTHQIFLRRLRLHVKYVNRGQFFADYGEVLKLRHDIREDSGLLAVVAEVETEVSRRRQHEQNSSRRRIVIAETYKPLYPDIYTLKEQYLKPEFLLGIEYSKQLNVDKSKLTQLLMIEGEDLYSLPVFTDEFCHKFVEELRHFEATDLPKGRPNTMNNSGVLLEELGFYDSFITPLRHHYLDPLCSLLYPDWVGQGLDSHKAFIVKYDIEGDTELNYHYDNSEVTINICLGDRFTDGGLYLGPMRTETGTRFTEYRHVIGRGLLHRGQQLHGAEPISDGERYNLIIWMRASSVRNQLCPMCNEKPKLIESQGFGDGFTKNSSGWCSSS